MELIPFSGHYSARFCDLGREVGLAATLASIDFGPRGVAMALEVDTEYAGAIAALDRSAADEVARRASEWFGQGGMTPDDVMALLRSSLSDDMVLDVASPAADRAAVLVQGRDGTLADARALGVPRRVVAFVRQASVRIASDSARAQWELVSIDLTPTVSAPVEEDAPYVESEPPEDDCVELEEELRARAEGHLAACRSEARRKVRDAEEVVALARGLETARGSVEWKARVAELVALLPPPPPPEDGAF